MRADVAVVGSGAGGAAVAGELGRRGASVVVLEAGPRLTPGAGAHPRAAHPGEGELGHFAGFLEQHLGSYAGEPPPHDIPGAVATHGVGGLLLSWTHNCPAPHPGLELPDGVPADAWPALLDRARALLRVSTVAVEGGRRQAWLLEGARRLYAGREPDRPVQPMPQAIHADGFGGADTLLEGAGVTLLEEHVVRALGATHVEAVPRGGGAPVRVEATHVVVAAGTIGNVKLLVASGIDAGPALGRFVLDHPHIATSLLLPEEFAAGDDGPFGVWIPCDAAKRLQTELVKFPVPLSELPPSHDERARFDVITTSGVEPREDNRLTFHPERPDAFGLPGLGAAWSLGDVDAGRLRDAVGEHVRVVQGLGHAAAGFGVTVIPEGASGHLAGSHRIGAGDDGESVADPHGRMWRAETIWLAGNGLLNRWSACNPTLTTVALALRTADAIAAA